ncbi:MAG: hypothetical protein GY842_24415 [bacterium]|nr:hypothetical protein [bacterium]
MLYAAMTFWLLVLVLSAWAVHQLWGGMVKPRAVNTVLLPGTLVAQLGHVLGLLVTGGTVNNTTLYKDDETGAPEQTQDPKPKVPIIGPVIIGMLPILACAAAIYFVAQYLGGAVVAEMNREQVATVLPRSLPAFWELLRSLITLGETTLAAALNSDLGNWHVWVFLYLLICLTVRMAPFPGNLRGSLGAIVVLGFLAFVVGKLASATEESIAGGWAVLSLSVGTLVVLLVFSLLVRGGVGLFKLLAGNA